MPLFFPFDLFLYDNHPSLSFPNHGRSCFFKLVHFNPIFKGPLGKELQSDITGRKPVRFVCIPNDTFPQLPEEVVCDLSTDQEYLYDICWAIIVGRIDDDFEFQQPGALCHSRWIGLANRILLSYLSTRSPGKPLKRLAHIVVEFYAPSWFWIKSHPLSKNGPENLLKMIKFTRKLTSEEQTIAQKVIQRNGFYAHPECILQSMLTDDD